MVNPDHNQVKIVVIEETKIIPEIQRKINCQMSSKQIQLTYFILKTFNFLNFLIFFNNVVSMFSNFLPLQISWCYAIFLSKSYTATHLLVESHIHKHNTITTKIKFFHDDLWKSKLLRKHECVWAAIFHSCMFDLRPIHKEKQTKLDTTNWYMKIWYLRKTCHDTQHMKTWHSKEH